MSEYSILTTRPEENLISCVVEFDIADYPPELESIDEAYMEAEVARQAEIDLEMELQNRSIVLGRSQAASLPFTLQKTKITPVTLWVRNLFPSKFPVMANLTSSPDLKKYLRKVMGLRQLTAT